MHGIETNPKGLDPAYNILPDEIQIYSQIYQTLVRLDSDGKTVLPNLVNNWEISEDYTQYKFNLKPSILFHDSTLLTSENVKISYLRRINLNPNFHLSSLISSIDIIDSLTFQIKLKYPSSTFLYYLASSISLIPISKKALKTFGNNIKYNPVGTGPFYLEDWKNGNELILNKFQHYKNNERLQNVDKIIFKIESHFKKSVDYFKNKKLDVIYVIPGHSIDRLKWLNQVNYKIIQLVNLIYIGFNNKNSILHNIYIRKAILRAINIPRLVINILRGNSITAKGPLPPTFFDYNNIEQQSHDLRLAKQYMEKAGIDDELTLKFFYPKPAIVRHTLIEYLKSNLSEIGIKLDVKAFDTWEAHNNACKSDSAQMFLTGWESDVIGDPENFLYSLFYSTSEYNVLQYKNGNVDNWLDQARRKPDRKKRYVLYRKIVKQILEDTPAVFLYHVKPHFAYNKNKIKKLPVNPYGIIQYHRVVLNE